MDYSINEVVKLTNITTDTIRYYEQVGLIKIKRKNNGYRFFNETDIVNLQFIKLYRQYGCSVEDCKHLLECGDIDSVKKIIRRQIDDIVIEELKNERRRQSLEKQLSSLNSYNNDSYELLDLDTVYLIENYSDGFNKNMDNDLYLRLFELMPITKYFIRIPFDSVMNKIIISQYGVCIREKDALYFNIDVNKYIKIEKGKYFSVTIKKNKERVTDYSLLSEVFDKMQRNNYQICGDILCDAICYDGNDIYINVMVKCKKIKEYV